MSRFNRAVLFLAACAPIALGVGAFLLGVGVPAVRQAFWHVEPTTFAEAVVLRDTPRIRFLMSNGASPTSPSHVRAGLLGEATDITPLEAAEKAGDADVLRVLREVGARPASIR